MLRRTMSRGRCRSEGRFHRLATMLAICRTVETQAQADAVSAMGCVAMQGWLFGTPIGEADMKRGDFPLSAYARSGTPSAIASVGLKPSSTMTVAS